MKNPRWDAMTKAEQFAESMMVFTRRYQEFCRDGAKFHYAGSSVYPIYEIITSNRELLQGEAE